MPVSQLHLSRLRESLDAIPELRSLRAGSRTPEFKQWRDRTAATILALLNASHPQYMRFLRLRFSSGKVAPRGLSPSWTPEDREKYSLAMDQASSLLTDLLEELSPSTPGVSGTLWDLLHPEIAQIARPRFEAGHLADAVEASLKHLNVVVQKLVLAKGGPEMDGASLMTHAFSPKSPIIELDDLSTDSGRNIQLGYMQMFAGAMTGVRNPKAHANVSLSHKRAIHLVFLASLLRDKLDTP